MSARIQKRCEICRSMFGAPAFDVARGFGRFCSHDCFSEHRRREALRPENIARRFWPKVAVGAGDECWEWKGALSCGYAVLGIAGRASAKASHVSWLLRHGRWPTAFMCHKCDNPRCVNPDHLFEGDAAINNRDACAKGRHAMGDKAGSRYSPEDILALHKAIRAGLTERQLVELFGVSKGHVYRVKHKKVWRHVLGASE